MKIIIVHQPIKKISWLQLYKSVIFVYDMVYSQICFSLFFKLSEIEHFGILAILI